MKIRSEEQKAMELLSKYVYSDKELFIDDKPDIQTKDLSVGIEHRYITTPSAEMQERFSEEYLSTPLSVEEAAKIKRKRYPTSDFGFLFDENGYVKGVIGSLSTKDNNWKVDLFKKAYRDKMKKLNGGGYRKFSCYDVFFTLDKYWVLEDELSYMSAAAIEINNAKDWKLKYQNIFILTPSCLWKIDSGSGVTTKIIIEP